MTNRELSLFPLLAVHSFLIILDFASCKMTLWLEIQGREGLPCLKAVTFPIFHSPMLDDSYAL